MATPVASVVWVSVPESVPPLGLEPMLIVIAMNGSAAGTGELSVAFTCTAGEMVWFAIVRVGCVTKLRAEA